MEFEMCEALLHHLDDGRLDLGTAPDEVVLWLTTLNLQKSLTQIMQHHWVRSDRPFLDQIYGVLSAESIKSDEFTQPLLQAQFLNIGFGPNGDWLVIDFSTDDCRPGFVSHEECDLSGGGNPRDLFQPIARTFEGLLQRIDDGEIIPIDYYEAATYNETADTEAGGA